MASKNSAQTVTAGAPWALILLVVLLTLKYTAYPALPWWLVTLPLWLPLVGFCVVMAVLIVVGVLIAIFK